MWFIFHTANIQNRCRNTLKQKRVNACVIKNIVVFAYAFFILDITYTLFRMNINNKMIRFVYIKSIIFVG